jgi:hypothetical protein
MKHTYDYINAFKKCIITAVSRRYAAFNNSAYGFYGIPVTHWASPPNGPPTYTY